MATIRPKTDDEIIHTIEDANPTSSRCVEELTIQCDNHGLSIECPSGEIVMIDFSRGDLRVFKFIDKEESNPELLATITARRIGETG